MSSILKKRIPELESMKKYPKNIYYKGNLKLLNRKKVSIVGTRRPNLYTKNAVLRLSSSLSQRKVVVVSGAAMGVDTLAHNGAGAKNSIAVLASGINHIYPKINRNLINSIEQDGGLILSQFDPEFTATIWSFVVRNELVVALGEVLIVAQADLNSGSLRSVEFAKRMNKPIYVLPHRLGESEGTNRLLKEGVAKAIYDIEEFADSFGSLENDEDEFLKFCKESPSYEETLKKFGQRLFEAELEGIVVVKDGRIYLS